MNLSQIIEALPPRVYVRCGELVIHFSTPGDLVSRVAETQAAFAALDRPEGSRLETRMRGKTNGRTSSSSHGESVSVGEVENYSPAKSTDGKED